MLIRRPKETSKLLKSNEKNTNFNILNLSFELALRKLQPGGKGVSTCAGAAISNSLTQVG